MRVDAYYVYCRTACNVLGLCSLEVKSIPLVRTIKSFSGHCQVSPGREGKIVSSWKQPTWMKRGLHSLPEDSGHFYMIMILYKTFFFFYFFIHPTHRILSLFFLKILFRCGPFLKSLLNLLLYCFCYMFWFLAKWHVGS